MPIAAKRRWQVAIVRRPMRFSPKSWQDVPEGAEELATPLRDLSRALALRWCRGFNEAELQKPYGVWAIAKRSDPRPAQDRNDRTNGHGKGL